MPTNGVASRLLLLAMLAVLATLAPRPAGAQQDEREHFQIKLSPSYDQGDFGTSETTRTFFVPLTLRYLGKSFDIAATFSYIRIDSPGDVVIVEGQPNPTGTGAGERQVENGFGDILLKGYFLVDDPGLPSPIPSVVPFLKLKIPTGNESKGLSTGKTDFGFGVELDKTFGAWIVFGDVSYTFMGDPDDIDFRNRPGASLGVGYRISELLSVAALVDWRRALVQGQSDPVDLLGLVTIYVTRTLSITPNVVVGLTDGSPNWGIGVELSWKFGRW
jgi:hypothetical protein